MESYQFIKDYKYSSSYRLSFNDLAIKTFGIDFESWYQQGFWNDNYICYSYLKDDKIVSNVSLNTMELLINGEIQKVIQIGTVMTSPEHRSKGLASQLLKKILEDYDQLYDFYFLSADELAVPLYKKCGFQSIDENKYVVDVENYKKLDAPLTPLDISPNDLLKIKKQANPLSTVLSARGDEHVLMIYYILNFSKAIYQPLKGVYVIFIVKGSTLHLYDILTDQKISLQELIEHIIPSGVTRVFCHFTPDQAVLNLEVSIDTTSSWMVRKKSHAISFPKHARFPSISQT